MASPPATPPAELPSNLQSWRFKDTGAPCEWAEEYRPGGFHPVDLGDTFRDGKYKIMVAKASTTNTELCIVDHLSELAPKDTRAQHVTVLLDTFQHQGINGKHQCLVFEPMGATAASLVEELPENKPKMYGKRQRYPKWMAKKILLHALRGLAFLHQNGVVHGDVQPSNLLFSIEDIDSAKEDDLKQNEAATVISLHRIDGKADRWAPKHLYLKQPLYDRVQLGSELCVKLSDLGGAFWLANPPSDTVTPVSLRAPELILHQPFGCSIDIWSFGCLMFEFLTGRTLFAVGILGNGQKEQDDGDDDHLIQLNDIIRPLPDSVMAAWPRAGKWYTPNRQRLQPYCNDEPYIHDSLEVLFWENKPAEIDDEESAVLCSLMRNILDYDPGNRPSAVDILKHPWFSE
ncbi:kinase-like protein [Melanomma pulvis-pyrius CBS 109.77]|uniref:non-specific serine/threonine protein kinase n=1 Tax=Melanomma pulvis-pyrius CBS 109.77 TaxID=1314802 RepID=A0A6A6WZQ1_9PLEO|nr:kinase-like protein [Melanomma pulvis-pyrius CBS 109.77]